MKPGRFWWWDDAYVVARRRASLSGRRHTVKRDGAFWAVDEVGA